MSVSLSEGLTLAVRAMHAGHGEDARRMLAELLAHEPANVAAHYLLGAELAQIGEWREGERHLATAVVLDPLLSMARLQLGQLLLVTGRYVECAAALQPLAQSTDVLSAYAQALIALARDDMPAAAAALEEGLAQPQEQEVLAKDMQHLLARIRSGALAKDVDETSAPGAALLLSNYNRYN